MQNSKNVTYVNKDGVEYIKFKPLEKYKNVECIFTLKSLDFKVKDGNKSAVIAEYRKVCNSLGVNIANLVVPKQTHTNIVKVLEDETGIYPNYLCEVDGIVTNKKNKILSLTFADCTPIALFDPSKNVIANVHSGWKGTLNSIVSEAIKKMESEFSCSAKDIICIIGPTIRKCHFEVEQDVRNMFFERYKYLDNISDIITTGRVLDRCSKI